MSPTEGTSGGGARVRGSSDRRARQPPSGRHVPPHALWNASAADAFQRAAHQSPGLVAAAGTGQRPNPPSDVSTCPTTQLPLDVANHPISSAGSCGVPTRPNGVLATYASRSSSDRSVVSGSM